MATTTRERAGTNGAKVRDELALHPPGGRGRLPEVAVGVLVTVGFALAGVLWHLNAVQKDPVLALAVDVGPGETIGVEDLRVVHVASDERVPLLDPSQSAEVIGRRPVSHLPAGTLVTTGLVSDGPVLAPGDGVVGLSLEAGHIPSGRLGPGDLVNVVAAPSGTSQEGALVAERAEVIEARAEDNQGRWHVSLRAEEQDANQVAAAAEAGPVRLVMVAP